MGENTLYIRVLCGVFRPGSWNHRKPKTVYLRDLKVCVRFHFITFFNALDIRLSCMKSTKHKVDIMKNKMFYVILILAPTFSVGIGDSKSVALLDETRAMIYLMR